ncbi:AraC family transcriptional regulator [Aliikangiella marina]|uniref:AraC family transcriptional regulator n=1 Tax=Aliikangiella marina TaxID=1712262 RepID=A0A545TJ68_9GAMM|nr:helix-turn-helix domain-containing protein [Aliikangiella marina]TQV77247.1 AraC family transcriptional regulator [Aliikangiella marina]
MLFSLYEVLLLIGITQGAITAILLWKSKNNQLSNRFIALGLVAFCLICAKQVLINLGITQSQWFAFIPIASELSAGPFFYFYVISLINPKFRLTADQYWHFLPFIMIQLYVTWIYLNVVGIPSYEEKITFARSRHYNTIKLIEDCLTVVSIFGYATVGYFKLADYRKNVSDNLSDNSVSTFSWILRIIRLSVALGVFLLVNLIIEHFAYTQYMSLLWKVFILCNAGLVYYFGFSAYANRDLLSFETEKLSKVNPAERIPDDVVRQIIKKIDRAIKIDKVYLNPQVSAQQLAKKIDVSQTNLSYVINSHYQQSFRDLINLARIEEVKEKLTNNSQSKYSILSIALDSGFNSEASFYRVFKKQTGVSPKIFMENNRENSVESISNSKGEPSSDLLKSVES